MDTSDTRMGRVPFPYHWAENYKGPSPIAPDSSTGKGGWSSWLQPIINPPVIASPGVVPPHQPPPRLTTAGWSSSPVAKLFSKVPGGELPVPATYELLYRASASFASDAKLRRATLDRRIDFILHNNTTGGDVSVSPSRILHDIDAHPLLASAKASDLGICNAVAVFMLGKPYLLNGYGDADAHNREAHNFIGNALSSLPESDPRYIPPRYARAGRIVGATDTAVIQQVAFLRVEEPQVNVPRFGATPQIGGAPSIETINVHLSLHAGWIAHVSTGDGGCLRRVAHSPRRALRNLHGAVAERLRHNLTAGANRPKGDDSWLV